MEDARVSIPFINPGMETPTLQTIIGRFCLNPVHKSGHGNNTSLTVKGTLYVSIPFINPGMET